MKFTILCITIALVLYMTSATPLRVDGDLKLFKGYGKSAQDWQGRRIYQIVTDRFAGTNNSCNPPQNVYCGGTFNGITQHLDYIKGMGFNAIWISPVIENTNEGYHGYWAKNFFAINSHFGTEQDLKAMVAACHALDIWVMVDVVINHVGPVGNDFGQIYPFNQSWHYHQNCAVNEYNCNTEDVWHCRLANLPDLNQDQSFVMDQLTKYVQWLFSDFAFDGIRADTVMYIQQKYWAGLQSNIGAYIVGEVWSAFSCNKIYTDYGIDGTLNYPLYYTLRSVFQSNSDSMKNLGNYWRQQNTLKNPNFEGNFLDNHDNTRFLNNYNNIPNYKSALAHMFFTNGVPIVLYGTEQYFSGTINGNECRQALWPTGFKTSTDMYKFLAAVNAAYEQYQPQNSPVEERWSDDSMYCFVRGVIMVCTTNTGNQQSRKIPNLPFAGKKVVNWLDQSQSWQGSSTMQITINGGQSPLILVGQ